MGYDESYIELWCQCFAKYHLPVLIQKEMMDLLGGDTTLIQLVWCDVLPVAPLNSGSVRQYPHRSEIGILFQFPKPRTVDIRRNVKQPDFAGLVCESEFQMVHRLYIYQSWLKHKRHLLPQRLCVSQPALRLKDGVA